MYKYNIGLDYENLEGNALWIIQPFSKTQKWRLIPVNDEIEIVQSLVTHTHEFQYVNNVATTLDCPY